MKRYFETYVSNSVAGSANQLFFSADRPQTGRIFYKIACGGEYSYSLLFSNVIVQALQVRFLRLTEPSEKVLSITLEKSRE